MKDNIGLIFQIVNEKYDEFEQIGDFMIKKIIRHRRLIQIVFALSIMVLMYLFKDILIYLLMAGTIIGVIFGKVFCRWICPIGLFVEILLSADKDAKNIQIYNYHKLGCPVAWVGGFFNRLSPVKIRKDESICISCGICDKNCYLAALNPEYSVYQKGKKNAASSFNCSKCLECVEKCPTGSLKYKI